MAEQKGAGQPNHMIQPKHKIHDRNTKKAIVATRGQKSPKIITVPNPLLKERLLTFPGRSGC